MASSKKSTRHSTASKLVPAEDLSTTDLPTVKDALSKMKFEREKLSLNRTKKIIEVKEIADKVLPDIKYVFKKVNSKLVLNNDRTILAKLMGDYKQMMDIDNSKVKGLKKLHFEEKLGKLLDIILCKCKIISCEDFSGCDGCEFKAHCLCECELEEEKIPEIELQYVLDQRSREGGSKGKFQMSGFDAKEMVRMDEEKQDEIEAEERRRILLDAKSKAKMKEAKRLENEKILKNEELDRALQNIDQFEHEVPAQDTDTNQDDLDFLDPKESSTTCSAQNRKQLRNLAMICDRYGVSARAGAAIANAALADTGVISADDQTFVIDKNKLRRSIDKFREERKIEDAQNLVEAQGEAYYMDGKKDITLFTDRDDNGKQFNHYKEEEHVSVSSEPGGKYVTHLTPVDGTGAKVAEAVFEYLREHGVIDSWKIIGGDSTAANTGVDRGAFVKVEVLLNRKLLRVVCTLHLNELPLRHVFIEVDGPTDSKNTFKGAIGKLLPKVEEFDFNPRFKKVTDGPGLPSISEDVASDLSSDQRLLYSAFQSVRTGVIRPELHSLSPGPISHSRWLTLAIRVLLLYMKKHGLRGKDITNLATIVKFLMTNYVVMWFRLKQKPAIGEAPRHLFSQVQLTNLLPKSTQTIARTNLARNAYWAHPENLLLSMLTDPEEKTRQEAIDRILHIRGEQDKGNNSTRKFIIPVLNFKATTYTELIDWETETLYEPSLTTSMTVSQLRELQHSPLSLPSYPAHTQSVERLVKQASRAASAVAGYSARDGFLRASAKSREMMPIFESKRDYQNNFLK